ncbi:hypothetical protein MG5_06194 [Candida albicans P57072]|nr:hypothetical protein MG5_06194 [Candida albicans P57072]KHC28178.1 hypothetical protein MGO_06164 [Candida albicans P76055]
MLHLSKAEREYFDAAYSLSDEAIKKLVELQGKLGLVKDDDVTYTVTIDHGKGTCTCNTEKGESSWCKHLHMYHKMRLLVFGDNMEKQMDFPVEDSQDYFSDEDDGSFSDIELENQERDFHFDNELASSYDDPSDIIDVVNSTSSNNEGTSTGQSDQNIPQKTFEELSTEIEGYLENISKRYKEILENSPEKVSELALYMRSFS